MQLIQSPIRLTNWIRRWLLMHTINPLWSLTLIPNIQVIVSLKSWTMNLWSTFKYILLYPLPSWIDFILSKSKFLSWLWFCWKWLTNTSKKRLKMMIFFEDIIAKIHQFHLIERYFIFVFWKIMWLQYQFFFALFNWWEWVLREQNWS